MWGPKPNSSTVAPAYNGGLWAEPPAGSRGWAPGQVSGAKRPTYSWNAFGFWMFNWRRKCAHFSKICKRKKISYNLCCFCKKCGLVGRNTSVIFRPTVQQWKVINLLILGILFTGFVISVDFFSLFLSHNFLRNMRPLSICELPPGKEYGGGPSTCSACEAWISFDIAEKSVWKFSFFGPHFFENS